MKRTTGSEEETMALASVFLDSLLSGQSGAVLVGLYGDLGSGKTTFMKGVAKHFSVSESVTSPTFVIMKIYKLRTINYKLLVHVDAYRLEKGEELNHLGFQEIVKDPKNIIFVEWPENVKEAMPEGHKKIFFKFIDDKTREINFQDI